MHKRCDDFTVQVLALISYQIAAASSILGHLLDHAFVAAISNSKRVNTDVVILGVCSFDNTTWIRYVPVCQQEYTCLRRILGYLIDRNLQWLKDLSASQICLKKLDHFYCTLSNFSAVFKHSHILCFRHLSKILITAWIGT